MFRIDPLQNEVEQHKKAIAAALDQQKASDKRIDGLKDSLIVLKKENITIQKRIDSAKVVTARKKVETKVLDNKLAVSTTAVDSIDVLLDLNLVKDSTIASLEIEVTAHEEKEVNYLAQIAAKDSIIVEKTATAATLTTVVKATPDATCTNKFFFCKIPKPSRITSFLGGVVVAAASVVAIR